MRILLIEDEHKTLQSLRQGMEEHGWTVNTATDGLLGLRLAMQGDYDVIVSDITMPGINGVELCEKLRAESIATPILLLTALNHTDDKVAGLDAGADDYLSKPFALKELLARVKALSRRNNNPIKTVNILTYLDVEQDLDAKTVRRAGQEVLLTPREFALLEFFLRNPGKVLSKTDIAEKVWDMNFDTGTNVVEVYVNYLRNKLDKGFDTKLIHTHFGQGYMLK